MRKDFFSTRHSLLSPPPFFLVSFAWLASLYCEECVCLYTHGDCVEIVYELSLLPNNIVSEIFLHKLGVVQSVDRIFIVGVPAWWWLIKYVTLDKTFYGLFKQEVVAAPVTSKFSSLLLSWTRPHLPPSSIEVKERVELYLYSPSGPSWLVPGWTLCY